MSALIFDVDKSLSAIGSDDVIAKLFGVPPKRITGGLSQLTALTRSLYLKKLHHEPHPLFPQPESEVPANEKTIIFRPRKPLKDAGIDTLIYDSISLAGTQERRFLASNSAPLPNKGFKIMGQVEWGAYGDALWDFIQLISLIPATVICTCHLDHEQVKVDGENVTRDVPALKGGTRDAIAKLFDAILYSTVTCRIDSREPGAKVTSEFYWQTRPDEHRPLAKSRGGILEPIIVQDLGFVVQSYKDAGFPYPKILILGETGHGKTSALKSLVVPYSQCEDERHVPNVQPTKEPDNGEDPGR